MLLLNLSQSLYMLHPFFSTLIQRPDLLMVHVSAYGALIQQEVSQAGAALVTRYIAWALAATFGVVFLLFSGVALMLGVLHNQFHWVLVAVPGCAFLIMLIAMSRAKAPLKQEQFKELKAQIGSDMLAMQAMKAQS